MIAFVTQLQRPIPNQEMITATSNKCALDVIQYQNLINWLTIILVPVLSQPCHVSQCVTCELMLVCFPAQTRSPSAVLHFISMRPGSRRSYRRSRLLLILNMPFRVLVLFSLRKISVSSRNMRRSCRKAQQA